MLVLGLFEGEYIMIGEDIIVQALHTGNTMKLAIQAPKDVSVVRGDVYERSNPTPQCIREGIRRKKH